VGSVTRAIALLDALAESDAGLGVNELARRIGVNASTASRLLATLESSGLVERAAGGPYRLGLRLVALSDRVLGQLDVRQRARPLLTRLAEQTGETATLSVPSGGEAVTVDFVPGASSVVSMARVGRPSILHATAVGKIVLAFGAQAGSGVGAGSSSGAGAGPPAATPLTAHTERTITDPDALRAEIATVRERGYAEAIGEREPDLGAVAVPVLGRGGELAAIIGIQGPASRLPPATRRTLRSSLREAAGELGALLGG
jgi:IclR family acetate operon transcriptional repressor